MDGLSYLRQKYVLVVQGGNDQCVDVDLRRASISQSPKNVEDLVLQSCKVTSKREPCRSFPKASGQSFRRDPYVFHLISGAELALALATAR